MRLCNLVKPSKITCYHDDSHSRLVTIVMQVTCETFFSAPEQKEQTMATNPAAPLENLRYLDDLQVGERFISTTHTLDAAQIKAFASQFDPQPFHLDELAAQDTLFGALAASGWHTAALTMK